MNLLTEHEEVKVFLKNGTTVEGIVALYTKTELVLRTPGSSDRLIIFNPEENVVMVRVIYTEHVEQSPHTKSTQPRPALPNPREPTPSRDPLMERAFKAAQRANENVRLERVAVAAKLKQPSSSHQGEANKYEFPNFTKRSPFQRPPKKNV